MTVELRYHDDVYVLYAEMPNGDVLDMCITRDPNELQEEMQDLERHGVEHWYRVAREGGPYA